MNDNYPYPWPQTSDRQQPLPNGKLPWSPYSTPLRVAHNGQFFWAPTEDKFKVRDVAKYNRRPVSICYVDGCSIKVTLTGGRRCDVDVADFPIIQGNVLSEEQWTEWKCVTEPARRAAAAAARRRAKRRCPPLEVLQQRAAARRVVKHAFTLRKRARAKDAARQARENKIKGSRRIRRLKIRAQNPIIGTVV
jgi:hypothetical protein